MCGVLEWWKVTLPRRIGQATRATNPARSPADRSGCPRRRGARARRAGPAVDEVHAAVGLVDILERDPAGDPLVVEIATPVALVLVPVGRRARPGGFARNWSYQNTIGLRSSAAPNSTTQARKRASAISRHTSDGLDWTMRNERSSAIRPGSRPSRRRGVRASRARLRAAPRVHRDRRPGSHRPPPGNRARRTTRSGSESPWGTTQIPTVSADLRNDKPTWPR